ncbi:MAG: flagellar export chaperone FliS [Hyphomicrobiales bacterium]|nr:flagellar export chaperone FliS [Rickettsiales bacterium]MCP5361309.1 flagellar export chaperone FliS [Hyphomicrobiales bacterium]
MTQMTQQKVSAYAAASQMVRKTKQVVMLYDGAIRYVYQAKQAIQENKIEARYNAIERASEIIIGLQASLDFENGGEVARTLYDYYAGIDMCLMQLHSKPEATACDAIMDYLKMMRESWDKVDQQMLTGSVEPAKEATPEATGVSPEEKVEKRTVVTNASATQGRQFPASSGNDIPDMDIQASAGSPYSGLVSAGMSGGVCLSA